MKTKLWLAASLLITVAILVGGCSGGQFRLSESEKGKVIEIALNTPEASKWLEEENEYRIGEVEWYAIEDSVSWHLLPYDDVETNPNYQLVPESAVWYPGVTIAVGEDTITQMQIAIDLETEKAVMILGPYPSLGSPDRFRP
jgi:hypothetical protein